MKRPAPPPLVPPPWRRRPEPTPVPAPAASVTSWSVAAPASVVGAKQATTPGAAWSKPSPQAWCKYAAHAPLPGVWQTPETPPPLVPHPPTTPPPTAPETPQPPPPGDSSVPPIGSSDDARTLLTIWSGEPIDNDALQNVMERLRAFCTIVMQHMTPNGWVWVELATKAQAERAARRLDGQTIMQGRMVINARASARHDWPPGMLPSAMVGPPTSEPLRRWQDPGKRWKRQGRKHK